MLRHLILTELKYSMDEKRHTVSLLLFLMPLYMLFNHSPSLHGFFYEVTLKDLVMYSLFILSGTFGLINTRILFLKKEKRAVFWNSLPISKKQKYWVNFSIVWIYHLPALLAMSLYGFVLIKLGVAYGPFLFVNLFLIYVNTVCILSTSITSIFRKRNTIHIFFILAGVIQNAYIHSYSNQGFIYLLNSLGITLPLILIAIGSVGILVSSQQDTGEIEKGRKKGPQRIKYRRWKGAFALAMQEQLYLFPKSLIALFILILAVFTIYVIGSSTYDIEEGFIELSVLVIMFCFYPLAIHTSFWLDSKNTEWRNSFYAILPTSQKLKRNSNLVSILISFLPLLPLNFVFAMQMIKNYPLPLSALTFVGLLLFEIVIYLVPIWADSKFFRLAKDGAMIVGFFFTLFVVAFLTDGHLLELEWIAFLMNPFWIIIALALSITLLYQTANTLAKH